MTPPPIEISRVESQQLQRVDGSFFSALGPNDMLLIDSSHVARIGSDVVHEYLSILPRLAPGVLVHVHDIFIPAEYPRSFIEEGRFFWNEQYILEALLTHNPKFEVIMPLHAMWRVDPGQMRVAIPSLTADDHVPSAFWIRCQDRN